MRFSFFIAAFGINTGMEIITRRFIWNRNAKTETKNDGSQKGIDCMFNKHDSNGTDNGQT